MIIGQFWTLFRVAKLAILLLSPSAIKWRGCCRGRRGGRGAGKTRCEACGGWWLTWRGGWRAWWLTWRAVREEDIRRVKIGWKRDWRKSHPMLWSRLRIERIWSPSVQFRSSWHLNLCHWAEFVEDKNSDSSNIICDNREQQCAHQWWWWRGSQWRWPSFLFPKKKDDDDRHFIPKKRMTVTVIASSLILKSVIKVVEMRSRLKRRIWTKAIKGWSGPTTF